MRVTTINVQITKQPKQYEAVRLGMDVSLDSGENEQDVIKAVNDELLAIYADMYWRRCRPRTFALHVA